MDHFSFSASKNCMEWSCDVSGQGNISVAFMQSKECQEAVDKWTALVKGQQSIKCFTTLFLW